MNRLDLRDTTLLAVTARDHAATLAVVRHCLALARFDNVVFFSDRDPNVSYADWHPCPSFTSHPELCPWAMTELPKQRRYFSDFVLSIHWDSRIVNPSSWTNEFKAYDYCGSPTGNEGVQNNGFYLSSRRYWWALDQLELPPTVVDCHPCDVKTCTTWRPYLERLGVKFAPPSLASRFATTDRHWQAEFGAHGTGPLRTAPPLIDNPNASICDASDELEAMNAFIRNWKPPGAKHFTGHTAMGGSLP